MGIADDRVDAELIERPRRWDMRFIGRFMVEFGLVSSVFDFLTFGVLLWVFRVLSPRCSDRLVHRVVADGAGHRARRADSAAVLPQSARHRPVGATVVLQWRSRRSIPYLPFVSALGFVPLPRHLLRR